MQGQSPVCDRAEALCAESGPKPCVPTRKQALTKCRCFSLALSTRKQALTKCRCFSLYEALCETRTSRRVVPMIGTTRPATGPKPWVPKRRVVPELGTTRPNGQRATYVISHVMPNCYGSPKSDPYPQKRPTGMLRAVLVRDSPYPHPAKIPLITRFGYRDFRQPRVSGNSLRPGV